MIHVISRRTAMIGALAGSASLVMSTQGGLGSDWPSRNIKVIVGGGAGSVPDSLARLTGDALSKQMGRSFVVENRPGAGGIAAMQALITSEPDGYTIALGTVSQAVFNSYLYSKLPYDPRHDIVPIAKLVASTFVVGTHPSVQANDLSGLAALSQNTSGELLVGAPPIGSPPYIAAVLLLRETGIKARLIPFRTGPDALRAAIRGDVHILVDGPTLLAPQVKEGKLNAIAITGRSRQAALPDVPTVAEARFPTAELESWMGLFGPRGTPAPVVARLNAETRAILAAAEFSQRLKAMGFTPQSTTAEEFARFVATEHARWSSDIPSAGLKIN